MKLIPRSGPTLAPGQDSASANWLHQKNTMTNTKTVTKTNTMKMTNTITKTMTVPDLGQL